MSVSVDTLVIGAGISGLAYAHARGQNADLLVLESSNEIGGWVRTEHGALSGEGNSLRFERGPEALHSGSPELMAQFRELALEFAPAPREARRRYLVHGGRLVALPHSPFSVFRSPLLSWSGKLRLLAEFRRARSVALDGSLADFVRHRFGPEVVGALLDPFVSGVRAGDPEQLSLRATVPELAKMVERHGSVTRALFENLRSGKAPILGKPKGGMGALADALAGGLGPRLRLGTPVGRLRRHGSRFGAVAGGEVLDCERVVIATPARAAAELLADVAPEVARAIATVTSESLASVLHAWPRERVAHPLDGFGYLVSSRERQLQLGTLFSSSIDPDCAPAGTVLLRTLLGGARHPEAVDLSDGELLAVAIREVAPLLGLGGDLIWSRVLRYRSALPRYDLAHPERLTTIKAALARTPGLHLLGNYLHGIGVPSLIEFARALARTHADAQPEGQSAWGANVRSPAQLRAPVRARRA